MEFVGNYAPRGLSPQTDGMPVIQKNQETYPFPGFAFSRSDKIRTCDLCGRKGFLKGSILLAFFDSQIKR